MTACERYAADTLRDFCAGLLQAAGMPADKAADVAHILVEADLTGHDTHGLNLLPTYLEHIEAGHMATRGEPDVIAELPAAATWDGKRLPGPWLVLRAARAAIERARVYGTGTITVRNSHHIACLSAYLRTATDQGMVMLLYASAPAAATVAPFGGRRGVFSPSPMAMGCPTDGDPILVDISTSITTNNLMVRLKKRGEQLQHDWLLDEDGNPTRDPARVLPPAQGTLLPLGGLEAGHKGYGLALMVEALTAGLSNHGRHQPSAKFANTVFVQVLNPAAFGGAAGLREQMARIAERCRETPPRPGVQRVRVPGEQGMARHREQSAQGVRLAPGILGALQPWAARLAVPMPAERGG